MSENGYLDGILDRLADDEMRALEKLGQSVSLAITNQEPAVKMELATFGV